MNHHSETVSDYELHAYVDNALDKARRLEVEAWLSANPEAAARVRDYQRINDKLHDRFDPVLSEPVEFTFEKERSSFIQWAKVAMVAGLMLVSGLIGWEINDQAQAPTSIALVDLVKPAAFAHQIYTADQKYPVEFTAVRQASLNDWVSERMRTRLQAPDLTHEKLKFIGGRLLPSTNRMAAQYMYEDEKGDRLTVYVRRVQEASSGVDFRYAEKDGLNIFYWIDSSMGYAVIGAQSATRLIAIANAVQAGFRGRGVETPLAN